MGNIPYIRLSAFYFVYFALVGVMSPYWPVYLSSIGFAGQEIGLIIALPMLTRLVAPNLWGWLADKTTLYVRVIQLGALLAFLVFAGLFTTTTFWGVVFFTVIFTFFWNAILPQFEVITLDFLKNRSHSYSLIRLWGSIGFIFAVVGLGVALDTVSPRVTLWVIWGLLLAIFGCALSLQQPTHEQASASGHRDPYFRYITSPATVSFLLAALLLHLSHGGYYGFYSLYLLNNGYSSTEVGGLWAIGVVAEIILFLKVPAILKRFSLRDCFVLSIAAAVLRWLLISFFVENKAIIVATQVFHALTFGLAHAVAIEYVRKYFPATMRGKAQALYSSVCFGGGSALGAYLSGYLWSINQSWCFTFAAVFALIGTCIAAAGMQKVDATQSNKVLGVK